MKKMANGGLVQDEDPEFMKLQTPEPEPSSFDVMGGDTTTRAVGMPPQDNLGMSASLPEKSNAPHPVVSQPAPQPTAQLPGMPPGIGANDLAPYIQQQKAQIQKFGPQQQVDLENNLVNQRNSLGYRATDALKGFGDALMMGVAGAGNPGWQQQFENQNREQGQEQLGALQKAHEGQIQDTESGMKLDMTDPQSSVSKAYRSSFAPIFMKMGYDPKAIMNMSASQIGTVADLAVKFSDSQTRIQLENAWRKAELGIQQQTVDVNKQGKRMEETKMKLEHPILNALGAVPDSSPDTSTSAAAGPYGASVQRNGKTYQWSPISKQYHPV